MTVPPAYDVFLSYHSEDRATVEAVAHRLKEAGLKPFLDKWHLVGGENWIPGLQKGMAESGCAAVFFGRGIGAVHDQEFQLALNRAFQSRDEFRLIPVLLPEVREADIPDFAKLRTWVDFRGGMDHDVPLKRLIAAVRGEPTEPAGFELPDEPAPFRGLEAFGPDQAQFFFGRDREIADVASRLDRDKVVVVVGASGCGKSSLVRAGLAPRLASHARPLWVRPGRNPQRALIDAAAAWLPEGERLGFAEKAASLMSQPDRSFRDVLSTLSGGSLEKILLVIDQLEELFLVAPPEAGPDFVRHLTECAKDGVKLVLTLRADAMGRALGVPGLRNLLQDRQVLLGEPGPEALREAVMRPAQAVGAYLERGLVSMILSDVLGRPGTLPLLQYAMVEVWRRRRGPWLTLEAYEAAGRVGGALSRRADKIMDGLDPGSREVAKRIFLRLTALGEGVADTRRRVPREELYPYGSDRRVVDGVLDLLSGPRARLVVTGDEGVELAHEAVIREWPRLRAWLDQDRAGLRAHRHLSAAAADWDRAGRDHSFLYRGKRLAEAERLAPGEWNAVETAFLQASIAEERLRKEQSKRRALGLFVGALICIVLAAGYVTQMNKADKATAHAGQQTRFALAQQYARAARDLRDQFPERSALLALAGMDATKEDGVILPQVYESLMDSLADLDGIPLSTDPGPQDLLEFRREGRLLVSHSKGGAVRLWDFSAGVPRTSSELPGGPVKAVDLSPDGRWVLTVTMEGIPRLWDLGKEGAPVSREFARTGSPIMDVAFSAGSRWPLLRTGDSHVEVWDATRDPLDKPFSVVPWGDEFFPRIAIGDGRWTRLLDESQGRLSVWDGRAPSEEPVWTWGNDPKDERGVRAFFSQDLRWVAIAGPKGSLDLLDSTRSRASAVAYQRPAAAGSGFAETTFTSDSRWALIREPEGKMRGIHLTTLSGSAAGHLEDLKIEAQEFRLSDDGRWLALWETDSEVKFRMFASEGLFAPGSLVPIGVPPISSDLWHDFQVVSGNVVIRDTQGQMHVLSLGGKISETNPIAVFDRPRFIVSAGKVVLNERPDGISIRQLSASGQKTLRVEGRMGRAALNPSGTLVAAGGQSGVVRIWPLDAPKDTVPSRLWHPSGEKWSRCVLSKSGRWLVAWGSGDRIAVWDLPAADPAEPGILLAAKDATDARFTADETALLIKSRSPSPSVLQWNLPVRDSAPASRIFPVSENATFRLATPARILVTADKTVRARPLKTDPTLESEVVLSEKEDFHEIQGLSQTERWIAIRSGDLQVYDLGRPGGPGILKPEGESSFPFEFQFSRFDGAAVSVGADVVLWDLRSSPAKGRIVLKQPISVKEVQTTSDGRWVFVSFEEKILAVDVAKDPPVVRPLMTGVPVFSIQVSPNDDALIAETTGGTRIWPLTLLGPAEAPLSQRAHEEPAYFLAFSPTSSRWAARCSEAIFIYPTRPEDISTSTIRLRFTSGGDGAMGFGGGDRWLIVEDGRDACLRWPLHREDLRRVAEKRIGRVLTPEERAAYGLPTENR